ncbi:hypothetical protein MAA5396_04770 [Marinovum algicola]|uniref:Uncharacterized protein n=1 Tax=Marinovum algicola TaxID=42444 RepID=A0A975WEN5_9RHOB|nr:hypothetical protein [Marinovum algicola]SEK08195.1 hypothetical protein SAMN04487940_12617 [Marinovum algicola]SLN76604.1 hypothetical protein MAA5396_04770 [Marinovum algicola]
MKSDHHQEIVAVIEEHVPTWQLSDWDRALLCRDWIIGELDGDEFTSRFGQVGKAKVADHTQQDQLLKDFEDALGKLISANARLHPDVRRSLNYAFSQNLDALNDSRTCFEKLVAFAELPEDNGNRTLEPVSVSRPLDWLTGWIFGCVHGTDPDLAYRGKGQKIGVDAISVARQAIAQLEEFAPKEQASDTWKKVMLVSRCRRIWADHVGVPPVKPSEGSAFHRFVGDMTLAIGENWQTDATVNAWRRLRDRDSRGQIF